MSCVHFCFQFIDCTSCSWLVCISHTCYGRSTWSSFSFKSEFVESEWPWSLTTFCSPFVIISSSNRNAFQPMSSIHPIDTVGIDCLIDHKFTMSDFDRIYSILLIFTKENKRLWFYNGLLIDKDSCVLHHLFQIIKNKCFLFLFQFHCCCPLASLFRLKIAVRTPARAPSQPVWDHAIQ